MPAGGNIQRKTQALPRRHTGRSEGAAKASQTPANSALRAMVSEQAVAHSQHLQGLLTPDHRLVLVGLAIAEPLRLARLAAEEATQVGALQMGFDKWVKVRAVRTDQASVADGAGE